MSAATSPFNPIPTVSFRLNSSPLLSKFSPRLGKLCITRPDHGTETIANSNRNINIEILTPGLIASTTRGVIQHLTRDNVRRTSCVKWVHVPFESFLQVDPPIPTKQESDFPLHTFLGFSPSQHILSLSLRDPADGREMPSNGNLFVAAQSSRGTRKVACPVYRSYVIATLPDIVFSMSDVPFNPPPHSQKRISKSIERSAQWLTTLLAPINPPLTGGIQDDSRISSASQNLPLASFPRLNVFVHMVGGIQPTARSAFAAALREPLEAKERALVQLETLDEGVAGYVFDLVPIRVALRAEQADTIALASTVHSSVTDAIAPLIRASLQDLPGEKPRLVNTTFSPHEMLRLIRDVGVDVFDTFWAQQAATWGVALDFRFPVPLDQDKQEAAAEKAGRHQIGHNLYEERFALDFTSLAHSFFDRLENSKRENNSSTTSHIGGFPPEAVACSCAVCSPAWPDDPLIHSTVDETGSTKGTKGLTSPYTRAYVHHLLHTHEMTAHALLAMHNLTVMNAFMCGVRAVLERERSLEHNVHPESRGDKVMENGGEETSSNSSPTLFAQEVARFEHVYDARLQVLDEGKTCWAEVDLARGKGRLARERTKALGDVVGSPVIDGTTDLKSVRHK